MKKILDFITNRYYRIGGLLISVIALENLFEHDNYFCFWMLVTASAVLHGLQDIIDEIKRK